MRCLWRWEEEEKKIMKNWTISWKTRLSYLWISLIILFSHWYTGKWGKIQACAASIKLFHSNELLSCNERNKHYCRSIDSTKMSYAPCLQQKDIVKYNKFWIHTNKGSTSQWCPSNKGFLGTLTPMAPIVYTKDVLYEVSHSYNTLLKFGRHLWIIPNSFTRILCM